MSLNCPKAGTRWKQSVNFNWLTSSLTGDALLILWLIIATEDEIYKKWLNFQTKVTWQQRAQVIPRVQQERIVRTASFYNYLSLLHPGSDNSIQPLNNETQTSHYITCKTIQNLWICYLFLVIVLFCFWIVIVICY